MKWFRPFIRTTAAVATLVSVQAGAQNERELLAPTGRLRVGVYLGSPLSMVRDPATGEARGLSVDLGKELANRLGVPFEQVTYQRIAEVLAAQHSDQVLNAILSMAGREDFVLVGKVEDLRRKVFELAALIGEPLVQDPGR
jgi:ABC-type amino acid transport substrate-binding protein